MICNVKTNHSTLVDPLFKCATRSRPLQNNHRASKKKKKRKEKAKKKTNKQSIFQSAHNGQASLSSFFHSFVYSFPLLSLQRSLSEICLANSCYLAERPVIMSKCLALLINSCNYRGESWVVVCGNHSPGHLLCISIACYWASHIRGRPVRSATLPVAAFISWGI